MANDFSGDANCVALWRFESGALTTDSIGSNTLTDNNTVGTDTTNFKEGSASADCVRSNSEYFSILDSSLDAGFPGKSGSGQGTFSVCFWVKFASITSTRRVITKYSDSAGRRGYQFFIGSSNQLVFRKGNASNASGYEDILFSTAFGTNKWYHVGVTYNDSDKSYVIRIWDDTAGALLSADKTGTAADNIYIAVSDLLIGQNHDGLIDEVVFFNDTLTTDEIDEIRTGTYTSTPTAAITGTITTATETDIINGGKVITITLTNDTWVAAGTGPVGTTAVTQAIIDGIDSAQAEAAGWDAEVKTILVPADDVARTSDTVVTITMPAVAAYAITANETITVTIPASALTAAGEIVAGNTFTITADGGTAWTKTLSDTITLSDGFSDVASFLRTLSDTINLSDDIAKSARIVKADTISMSDNFSSIISLILALNDTINMSDSIASKEVGILKSDTINLSDNFSKIASFLLSIDDSVSLSDAIYKSANIEKSDSISLSDNVSIISAFIRSFSDTFSMSDDFNSIISIILALNDTINMSDAVIKEVGLTKTDTVSLSDDFSKVSAFIRTFTDTINLSDESLKSIALALSDSVSMTDNFNAIITLILSLSDTISMSDSIVKEVGLTESDTINLADNVSIVTEFLRTFSDNITMTDEISKTFGLNEADIISLADEFSTSTAVIYALLNFIAKNKTFNFIAKNKTFNFIAKNKTFNFNAKSRG